MKRQTKNMGQDVNMVWLSSPIRLIMVTILLSFYPLGDIVAQDAQMSNADELKFKLNNSGNNSLRFQVEIDKNFYDNAQTAQQIMVDIYGEVFAFEHKKTSRSGVVQFESVGESSDFYTKDVKGKMKISKDRKSGKYYADISLGNADLSGLFQPLVTLRASSINGSDLEGVGGQVGKWVKGFCDAGGALWVYSDGGGGYWAWVLNQDGGWSPCWNGISGAIYTMIGDDKGNPVIVCADGSNQSWGAVKSWNGSCWEDKTGNARGILASANLIMFKNRFYLQGYYGDNATEGKTKVADSGSTNWSDIDIKYPEYQLFLWKGGMHAYKEDGSVVKLEPNGDSVTETDTGVKWIVDGRKFYTYDSDSTNDIFFSYESRKDGDDSDGVIRASVWKLDTATGTVTQIMNDMEVTGHYGANDFETVQQDTETYGISLASMKGAPYVVSQYTFQVLEGGVLRVESGGYPYNYDGTNWGKLDTTSYPYSSAFGFDDRMYFADSAIEPDWSGINRQKAYVSRTK